MDEAVIIKIPSVEEWTTTQLKYTCRNNKVKGYTKMSRAQLIVAVKEVIENIGKSNKEESKNKSYKNFILDRFNKVE